MMDTNFISIEKYIENILMNWGVHTQIAYLLNIVILLGIIVLLAVIANFIVKKIIVKIIKQWVDKSENDWDDIIYEKGVFNKLSHLAPALVIMYLSPLVLHEYESWIKAIEKACSIYMIISIQMVLIAFINALHEIFHKLPISKGRSIKGYVQVVKILVYFIFAMLIVSALFNTNLSSLFAGLGAMTAVLLFVFKDAILGLIAGIQISANDILKIGDYIEMPSKGADGVVIDISLNTVKVLNSNKTITPIPTYSFVNESFQNWRGLELTDGRRIKRTINIDIRSICFCPQPIIEKWSKHSLTETSINEQTDISTLTNMQLFRVYAEAYLKNHNGILKKEGYTFLVRELQPDANGLPIEIFVYTVEKVLASHEKIQAEVFDHLFAVIPEFGLRIFQNYTNDQYGWNK